MAKIFVEKSGPLKGEVTISGSKNAVLPVMAAAMLTDERCVIADTPALRDVEIMSEIIRSMGAEVTEKLEENIVEIETREIKTSEAPADLVRKMRASILILAPVLARTGKAVIPLPGGCAIGKRPIELHLKGLKALGADIISGEDERDTKVEARAEKLHGANIYLDYPSVGATEVIITAAALAEGTTVIENAAQEPEIIDLANYLNKMGARVRGAGTDTVKIDGVEKLKGASHRVIPDRIEAGTYMVAAAITKGDILLRNVIVDHIKPVIAKLRECGAVVEPTDEGLRVRGDINPLISTDIKTLPYPGFPTDMQSPFMALLTVARGPSVVQETVFENRYMHVKEFNRMGAGIKVEGHRAYIPGGKKLRGAKVIATDLRAGAAVILAGLVASGKTEVAEIFHIDRGYEKLIEKFEGIGARITREEDK
ncbi:MAG: UDP-N-acetylglucosamine 1-carboxyvinyltransferase [Firmicutes bacterium]|nr:UDP-N-acetylglucosamine 1-carboxyvinyltransferase [Bacillota bacterium]